MKQLNYLFKLFFVSSLFSFFLFLVSVPANAGFGVSPAEIYSEHLKPGAVLEQNVVLSRSDPDEDLIILVEPELPDMESWFDFSPGSRFVFPKGQSRINLKVTVTVPKDVQLKNYKGILRIKATTDEKKSGVSVVKGARMDVSLVTTDIDFSQLIVRSLAIPDFVQGQKLKLNLNVQNKGNIAAAPTKVVIEIRNLQQGVVETVETSDIPKVAVNQTSDISTSLKNSLLPGEYFGLTKVYFTDKIIREERLVFKVSPGQSGSTTGNESTGLKLPSLTILVALVLIFLLLILIVLRILKKISTRILLIVAVILALVYSAFYFIYHRLNPSPEVAGVSTQISPTAAPEPQPKSMVVVKEDSQPVEYSLYREPRTNSKIVYHAQEGEDFEVILQTLDWYQVKLSDGSNAWLPKTSVSQKSRIFSP